MKQDTALKILKTGRNGYLTGAAGSGKTHILNEYIKYLRDRGVSVAVTASTGIAATHIGGITIHSFTGIGVKNFLSDRDIEYLVKKDYLRKRFHKTQVLIIDEISMLSAQMFDDVNRVCRAMKSIDKPFGGMQVVLAGDFFQLPPIVSGSDKIEFVNASRSWREMDVRVCYLEDQYRQEDNALKDILNEMRGGVISQKTRNILIECTDKSHCGNIAPTRLYTHNKDVDILNERELDRLPGRVMEFTMQSKGKSNIVEALKRGVLASEVLRLKKNAVVMFVKNNFEAGYANGTLGVVDDFDDEGAPIVRLFSGEKITVSPMQWAIEEDGKILARVEQLPLRLAWAITVHKSQGMSMDAAEIDLSGAFVPGQGYVALSRLRTLAGLVLRGINEVAFAVSPDVASFDECLIAESEKWEKAISQFGDEQIRAMHRDFILKSGGTIDEEWIIRNRQKDKETCLRRQEVSAKEKLSTYEKTKEYIKQGLSLGEIARERGMTIGTIISHLEKLKESGVEINFDKFKPNEHDLGKIKEAFQTTKDTKLSPAHRLLGGAYSYEEIRLARLFL